MTQTSTHNFVCDGCGASMSYDASARTLRCPFCGSLGLSKQEDSKSIAPQRIVRFAVDHQRASAILRQWLGRGFWRPGDLANAAEITKVSAVYVPYWVFQARTHTYWTADSNQVPFGARGDWVPVFGEHHGAYQGLLIGASGVLTPQETSDLCPYDLSAAEPTGNVDTDNVIVEQFRVQRKYARPLAHQSLENLDRNACQHYVPGRCRNLRVNVLQEGLTSEPLLLPVWMMAYRYRDRVFRFLINGQTGRASGQAPVSWNKILGVIAIAGLFVLLVFLAMAIVAAL
jgi:DNA-directed RNA polymerase subunit RPC12/RpoP